MSPPGELSLLGRGGALTASLSSGVQQAQLRPGPQGQWGPCSVYVGSQLPQEAQLI
jgi:hypothetical protein